MKNKLLIATIIVSTFVILLMTTMFTIRLIRYRQIPSSPTAEVTTVDPALSAPPLENSLTPNKISLTPEEEEMSRLIKQLPIKTDAFNISMNYADSVFVVQIAQPGEANYKVFEKWLVDNNFSKISKDKFRIVF